MKFVTSERFDHTFARCVLFQTFFILIFNVIIHGKKIKKIIQSTLFVIVLLLFGTGITSFKSKAQENDIFNISINPEANEAFLLAVYTLYIPPNVKELKGIIVK